MEKWKTDTLNTIVIIVLFILTVNLLDIGLILTVTCIFSYLTSDLYVQSGHKQNNYAVHSSTAHQGKM